MIAPDASAAVNWMLQTPAGQGIEKRILSQNESLHSLQRLDLAFAQLLRRLVRERAVSADRADEALKDFLDLGIARYPHVVLLPRIWQLRDNFSAYDGAYVVLAEELGATLITRDSRLATASGHDATIELV